MWLLAVHFQQSNKDQKAAIHKIGFKEKINESQSISQCYLHYLLFVLDPWM